jgi:hypothetical protein
MHENGHSGSRIQQREGLVEQAGSECVRERPGGGARQACKSRQQAGPKVRSPLTGMSSKSIQEVMLKPPLHVTGAVGAVGNTHLSGPPTVFARDAPISCCRKDHPAPESPRPCSHTTPALNLDILPTGGTKGVETTLSMLMQFGLCSFQCFLCTAWRGTPEASQRDEASSRSPSRAASGSGGSGGGGGGWKMLTSGTRGCSTGLACTCCTA